MNSSTISNNRVFNVVAYSLLNIAKATHMTYNEINIIVYYCLIPLFWAGLIDFAISSLIFTPFVLGAWAGIFTSSRHFKEDCDYWFVESQKFLLSFKPFGWDYVKASVIICVVVPIILTTILFAIFLI